MHLKRNKVPKAWPIPRKGSTFIAIASHEKAKSIPLLVVLRDILKIAKTRKEIKHFVFNGDVKINNKVRRSELFPVQVFDIVNLEKTSKNYRMEIVNKKFALKEISGKEKDEKIVKIIGKRTLGKDRVQMNLQDGQNFLTKEKFKLGDSAIINTKENKIVKILEIKSGAKVEIISGKHAGEMGVVKEIIQLKRKKSYKIKLEGKEVEVPFKTLLVVG